MERPSLLEAALALSRSWLSPSGPVHEEPPPEPDEPSDG
ncbi:hypothetical protein HNR71_002736 [Kribbella sandramycini]|uniref:Uncharacterized protein n=1 Tax=Kribbella sandramycini TaxID=60450 RepID=A0A841S791_9ACTN|nr:hypothetical protein [Kribbella sandramycini]